ncbi:unnamed protein product [Lactuca virosa]|uniref:Uncharacterized protein n=1 Tax=Lactuca virosa TaxID=75947 RepID=A0AAU9LRS4_9ASTR|nr:unnamed protein product [Lactuca virosa]
MLHIFSSSPTLPYILHTTITLFIIFITLYLCRFLVIYASGKYRLHYVSVIGFELAKKYGLFNTSTCSRLLGWLSLKRQVEMGYISTVFIPKTVFLGKWWSSLNIYLDSCTWTPYQVMHISESAKDFNCLLWLVGTGKLKSTVSDRASASPRDRLNYDRRVLQFTGLSIVGYFHANERFDDLELGTVAKNIADHVHRYFPQAAVLLLDNKKLGSLRNKRDKTPAVQVYARDSSSSSRIWKQVESDHMTTKEPSANIVLLDFISSEKWNDIVDFDDHLDDITKDWLNSQLFK